jgi:hypothetical protein
MAIVFAVLSIGSICNAASMVTSDHYPKVERLQNQIIIPYQIREFEKDGTRGWEYYEHRVPDAGQTPNETDALGSALAERVTMRDEALALLNDLKYSDVDKHVDNVFTSLTAAQKTSLKRLYKAVLYLLKEREGNNR